MILEDVERPFESHGVKKKKKFSVQVDKKLFSVLFDRMYGFKIKAVIRELSCNADEIHQFCGKENIPFRVKLPNQLDTNFIVRDFASGLSSSDIDILYTRVFASSKENSNSLGGMFGIGASSPWAYCDSFIVNSYFGGSKYIYFFVKDDEGCPSYSLASKTKSSEPSGLEIIIAVNESDIKEFCETAKEVFRYFVRKPLVVGNSNYKHFEESEPLVSGTGWKYFNNSDDAMAIMGNIGYSLHNFNGKSAHLLKDGLELYFDIGKLSPNPSRESLSFDHTTIANIEAKLKQVSDEYQMHCENKISQCKNIWEAGRLYYDLNNYFSLKSIKYNGHLVSSSFVFSNNQYLNVMRSGKRDLQRENSFYFRDECGFIVDDLPKGGPTRVRQYLNGLGPSKAFYCKFGEDSAKFKELLMIEDDQIVLTSSLPKPVYTARPQNRISNAGKALLLKNGYSTNSHCWGEADVDFKAGTGYYVEINKNRWEHNGVYHDARMLYNVSDFLGIQIYGVKSAHIKKLGSGWTKPFSFIESSLIKLVDDSRQIKDNQETYNELYRDVNVFCNSLDSFKKQFKSSNELTDFYDAWQNILKDIKKNASVLVNINLADSYLSLVHKRKEYFGTVNPVIKSTLDRFQKTYPLLFCNYFGGEYKELFYYADRILKEGRV